MEKSAAVQGTMPERRVEEIHREGVVLMGKRIAKAIVCILVMLALLLISYIEVK